MSGYRRYPAYKERGVEWIGEILLIEIKRRQIELLKEERTSVINHVVTRG
jgi:hypothetical protein